MIHKVTNNLFRDKSLNKYFFRLLSSPFSILIPIFIILTSFLALDTYAVIDKADIKISILKQRLIDEQDSYQISKNLYDQVDGQATAVVDKVKNNLLKTGGVNTDDYILEQLRLQASRINLYADNIAIDRDSAQQDILADENAIYQLENKQQVLLGLSNPNTLPSNKSLNANIKELQDLIQYHRTLLDVNKQRLVVLNKHYDFLNQAYAITHQASKDLQIIVDARLKENELAAQSEQELKITQKIKHWLKVELAAKRELKINDVASFADLDHISKYNNVQTIIIEAENNRGLLDLELSLLKLDARMSEIIKLFESNSIELLKNKNNLAERLNRVNKESSAINALAKSKLSLIKDTIQTINKEKQTNNISLEAFNAQMTLLIKFNEQYTLKIKKINEIIVTLAKYTEQLKKISIQDISLRQNLPYGIEQWQEVFNDIVAIPFLLSKQVLAAGLQFKSYFENDTGYSVLKLFLLQSLVSCLVFLMYKYLNNYINQSKNPIRGISSSGVYLIIRLINYNKALLAFILNIYALLWLADLSGSFIRIFLCICAVLLICRVIIHVCYILLIENVQEISGDDRKLFNGLNYSFIFGGLLSVMMILGQELNLPSNTQSFIDRLSMLFLLAVSYPLIINWQVMPQLIIDNLQPKSYVKKAIWLIGLIVPITILSNAALGIIGYVNLAWTIAIAELQLSLIIALWLILKGLLNELMEYIFRFFIRNVTNGWLWTESILKPLHTLFNVFLFLSACIGLVFIYGWNSGVALIQLVTEIFNTNIIASKNGSDVANMSGLASIYGLTINIKDFLIFCIIFSFVIWATKWSREFSYRWLYSKTKDLGVRNSLAVFTQYTTLFIGIIVILKVLHVPLESLSVAIGGFVLFIGFGLRDIISNYASGLILLIERPIRVGDFVTIGTYEGKVTKIGMRSITIESFDNMDVIVPNTDTITKSLTNWTFKDTIIRMEVAVRVGFNEDLDKIRELILSVLRENNDVLDEPAPYVYFKELSESSIITVAYLFIDLNKTASRGTVRTAVITAINRVLRANNISAAYPHMVHLSRYIEHDPDKEKLVI